MWHTWSHVSRSITSSVARSSWVRSPGTSSIWKTEGSDEHIVQTPFYLYRRKSVRTGSSFTSCQWDTWRKTLAWYMTVQLGLRHKSVVRPQDTKISLCLCRETIFHSCPGLVTLPLVTWKIHEVKFEESKCELLTRGGPVWHTAQENQLLSLQKNSADASGGNAVKESKV